jgi:hypothetical protein
LAATFFAKGEKEGARNFLDEDDAGQFANLS